MKEYQIRPCCFGPLFDTNTHTSHAASKQLAVKAWNVGSNELFPLKLRARVYHEN